MQRSITLGILCDERSVVGFLNEEKNEFHWELPSNSNVQTVLLAISLDSQDGVDVRVVIANDAGQPVTLFMNGERKGSSVIAVLHGKKVRVISQEMVQERLICLKVLVPYILDEEMQKCSVFVVRLLIRNILVLCQKLLELDLIAEVDFLELQLVSNILKPFLHIDIFIAFL